jgi:hypothetical protein
MHPHTEFWIASSNSVLRNKIDQSTRQNHIVDDKRNVAPLIRVEAFDKNKMKSLNLCSWVSLLQVEAIIPSRPELQKLEGLVNESLA